MGEREGRGGGCVEKARPKKLSRRPTFLEVEQTKKDLDPPLLASKKPFRPARAPPATLKPATTPPPKPPTRMRVLTLTLLAACLGQAVAPPPPPGPNASPSFPSSDSTPTLTAWTATGAPAGTLPALPRPVVQVAGTEEVCDWGRDGMGGSGPGSGSGEGVGIQKTRRDFFRACPERERVA